MEQGLAAAHDLQARQQGLLQRCPSHPPSSASDLCLTSASSVSAHIGTGPVPGLGPKSQGHFPFSKSKYVRDPAKARYFVAPEGWKAADGQIKGLYTSPVSPCSLGSYRQLDLVLMIWSCTAQAVRLLRREEKRPGRLAAGSLQQAREGLQLAAERHLCASRVRWVLLFAAGGTLRRKVFFVIEPVSSPL